MVVSNKTPTIIEFLRVLDLDLLNYHFHIKRNTILQYCTVFSLSLHCLMPSDKMQVDLRQDGAETCAGTAVAVLVFWSGNDLMEFAELLLMQRTLYQFTPRWMTIVITYNDTLSSVFKGPLGYTQTRIHHWGCWGCTLHHPKYNFFQHNQLHMR